MICESGLLDSQARLEADRNRSRFEAAGVEIAVLSATRAGQVWRGRSLDLRADGDLLSDILVGS